VAIGGKRNSPTVTAQTPVQPPPALRRTDPLGAWHTPPARAPDAQASTADGGCPKQAPPFIRLKQYDERQPENVPAIWTERGPRPSEGSFSKAQYFGMLM